MATARRKVGAHLDERARTVLREQKVYPSAHVFANPLTRPIARAAIAADWKARLGDLDFPYTMDDAVIGGVACVRYRTSKSRDDGPLLLYAHAGAFVAGGPRINAAAILPACEAAGATAVGVGYALAPEAQFPRQIDEIGRVFRALIDDGRPAASIVLVGDSAGGGLALSAMNAWRRGGAPAPAGVALLSPLVDCAGMSDTHHSIESTDPVFGDLALTSLPVILRLYAPDRDARDPAVSPVYASYVDAPPLLVHAGSREVLLGDAARLCERARDDGVDAQLRVHDGMFHLFHMHGQLAAARRAHADLARFVATTTGR